MLRRMLAIIGVLWVASLAVAGTWTPNNFLYKPSTGARGEAEKNIFENALDQVDQRLGKEIWVGDPGRGTTLQSAVTAIGGSQTRLKIPAGTWSIGANFTIPANVTLKPERGAILSIANGVTLTINGTIDANDHQLFSWTGTGAIKLSGTHKIKTSWFGDSAAGIQKAIDSTPGGGLYNYRAIIVEMPGRDITLETPVTIKTSGITLQGQGAMYYGNASYGTRLIYLGSGAGLVIGQTGYFTSHVTLKNFILDGSPEGGQFGTKTGEHGLQIGIGNMSNIPINLSGDSVTVTNFTSHGIDFREAEYSNFFRVSSGGNGGEGLKVGIGYSALVKFDTCSFSYNSQEGVLIDPGATVGSVFADGTFINCDFQANGYEALRAASSRSLSIKNLKLMSCWLEGNNANAARAASGGYFDVSLVGTAAQRIGTVSLSGNEWGSVQNRVGTDIVVNGGFGGDTDWAHDAGWTLSGTVATHTPGSVTVLEPSTPLTIEAGVSYLVSYTIGTRTAGFIKPVLGGRSGPTRSLNGTYYDTIYATTTGNLQFVPTSEFNGTLDNVSVKKLLNRALFANGVDRLVCQGNQWENVDAYGTQCIFGAVGASEYVGVLSMDDPDKLWEWNNNIKVISKLHGDKYMGGAGISTTGISSGVVLQNANIPKRSWTCSTVDNGIPRYDYGGGSGNSVRIVAQGTKTGTVGAKVITLTFGGRTVATLTSATAAPWTIECDITHLYHSSGAGTFYYTTKMYDGNTVTHSNGTLGGGTAVNIYESVPIQVVGTAPTAGEVIAATLLKYERE